MTSFMEEYGEGEYRRSRTIRRIVIALFAAGLIGLVGYLFIRNYSEKSLVKRFATHLNAKQFDLAYHTWGCSDTHPCRDYSYERFMQDWGPDKAKSDWKITDTDGCPTGVIITVNGTGTEPASLWIDRGGNTIGFSPWPECQGKKWRWQQFFKNIF
jgi:hypothetical protein